MTTPSSQDEEEVQPPPEEDPWVEIIAGLLLVGASTQATVASIQTALLPLKLLPEAVVGAVRIALSRPFRWPKVGSANLPTAPQVTRDREVYYRSAYLFNAAKRIHKDLRAGKPLVESLRKEKRNFDLHLQAVANRRTRATEVNRASLRYGDLLGWKAVMDATTSSECRDAHGQNFHASRKPWIGYPGTVHPMCRCLPVKPYEGASVLPSRKPRQRRRTAA